MRLLTTLAAMFVLSGNAIAEPANTPEQTIAEVKKYGADYVDFLAVANNCQDALEGNSPLRTELCGLLRIEYISRIDQMKKVSVMCIEQLKAFSDLRKRDVLLANEVNAYCGTIPALNATPRFNEVTEVLGRTP